MGGGVADEGNPGDETQSGAIVMSIFADVIRALISVSVRSPGWEPTAPTTLIAFIVPAFSAVGKSFPVPKAHVIAVPNASPAPVVSTTAHSGAGQKKMPLPSVAYAPR